MPEPQDVCHRRFPVSIEDVLFNDGDVSLAFSIWDKSKRAVGIRWNYKHLNHETKQGYPNYGSHPLWFIMPNRIAIATLNGLLQDEFPGKDVEKIRAAINMLECGAELDTSS